MEYTLGKSNEVVSHHDVDPILKELDLVVEYMSGVHCTTLSEVESMIDELNEIKNSEVYQKYDDGMIDEDGNDLTDDELYLEK